MKIKAPAKTNLFLRVARKRDDGYHEIETIFVPLENLSDTVELTDSNDGKLSVTCSIPALSGPDNLCHKAAEAFAKSAKIRPAWKIHVIKRIPVAAGLGGGSSDAAGVLRLLQQKYPHKISEADILYMASKLGADVPFFLNPVPSIATGIGEKIKPLALKCWIPIVVVFPGFPVSAKWAYRNRIKSSSNVELKDIISALDKNDNRRLASLLRNDLAPALWKKFPLLSILKDGMLKAGALGVEVSGSGSSLLAVAKSAKSADRIVKEMDKRFENSVASYSCVTG
ncbi:MAG TPA: 4-(cytidine 5'-diphospho)-2-C-methyl-D-erythritol kinase [Lentisphaeria bacterium]|nr:MAG: 4-(cytidine 5'-diphospho)-2-C-methyl-D-erythritol kinase [Lentisphaerae bacterium GWF2_50_93]HCE44169.1 4-(cytidine 5'-diphospho)-2-C-methyl-D-erythritol kinase [Lentisphaeria bacterium]